MLKVMMVCGDTIQVLIQVKKRLLNIEIEMLQQGYKGAFIVVFNEGSRLTLNEAGFDVNPDFKDKRHQS
jgi:hypothetical protein